MQVAVQPRSAALDPGPEESYERVPILTALNPPRTTAGTPSAAKSEDAEFHPFRALLYEQPSKLPSTFRVLL